MNYPDERDITNPATTLPPQVAAELVPLVEAAQRRYRRFRQSSVDYGQEPHIVIDHAAEVFKTLAVLELRLRSATFQDFCTRIRMDAGAANTAFRYAHYLYKNVQGGRMLAIWHRQVRDRLFGLIREAEDLWWNPDVVPQGWEDFITNSGSSRPAAQGNVAVQGEILYSAVAEGSGAILYPPGDGSPDGDPTEGMFDSVGGERENVSDTPSVILLDHVRTESSAQRDNALTSGQERRAMVDAFIETCRREAGVTVTRKMIWSVAGYSSGTDFERWQRNSAKVTLKSAQMFAQVLSMRTDRFVDLLRKRQTLP
ncbi:MAG TPA: hypothetical protein VN428_04470 [Bryobacteraceae bacterium]|nr:hypothetical protein [Bryobacteraceae bacterium]